MKSLAAPVLVELTICWFLSCRRNSGNGPKGRPSSAEIRRPEAVPRFKRNLRTRLSTIAWLRPASSNVLTTRGWNSRRPFEFSRSRSGGSTEGADRLTLRDSLVTRSPSGEPGPAQPRRDAARKPSSQVRKRQTEARAQDQKALVRQKVSTGQARKIGEDKGSEASESTWRRDQETKLASQAPYLSHSKVRGRNPPAAASFGLTPMEVPLVP